MRVLVVDDDADSRIIYTSLLQSRGHEVLAAVDGLEGVRLAEVWGPDVILMDLGVPGIDGWEATRRIKAGRETRSIPVIAVSAHALPEHRARAREAGCCCYLTKPVDPHEVVANIQRTVLAA